MKYLIIIFFILSLTSCFQQLSSKKVLFVVTSHSDLGTTGEKTGAYITEVTHPYHVLSQKGVQIDFASPKGGKTPLDGMDQVDDITKKLLKDEKFLQKLNNAQRLKDVNPSSYDAIYFAGGHGTMFDLPDNEDVQRVTAEIYENGGAVAAVCHGPVALVNVKLKNGKYLVEGKEVASFTNEEEEAVKLTKQMPFLLESKLIERGGRFTKKANFKEHVVETDRLITGQNPASATKVGQKLLQILQK
jgi:putative intracellular protease/amidase